MGSRSKVESTAFKMKFIERLALRLDIPYKVASLIYDTYGVVALEMLNEGYDRVKVMDFLFVEKRYSPKKKMINVHTGEEIETVPKAKLYCSISRRSKNWDDAWKNVEEYYEQEERRKLYEVQVQKEQEAKQLQKELERKQREKERKKKKRKANKRRRREQQALRRLIKYEEMFHTNETKKYQKELERRKRGK